MVNFLPFLGLMVIPGHLWTMFLKSIWWLGMPEKLVPIVGKLIVIAARRSGTNLFVWQR